MPPDVSSCLHAVGRGAPDPVVGRERRGGQIFRLAQMYGVAGGIDAVTYTGWAIATPRPLRWPMV